MTLGRLRRGGRWNDQLLEKIHRLRNHDGGFCTVDRIIVYSSYLDRAGPTYTPMATISLAGLKGGGSDAANLTRHVVAPGHCV